MRLFLCGINLLFSQISKSFWVQDSSRKIEIDTSRLYEHFAVKNLGTVGVTEHSNSQNIMLNQKIAHTFGKGIQRVSNYEFQHVANHFPIQRPHFFLQQTNIEKDFCWSAAGSFS